MESVEYIPHIWCRKIPHTVEDFPSYFRAKKAGKSLDVIFSPVWRLFHFLAQFFIMISQRHKQNRKRSFLHYLIF
jgi:hypothetical protein